MSTHFAARRQTLLTIRFTARIPRIKGAVNPDNIASPPFTSWPWAAHSKSPFHPHSEGLLLLGGPCRGQLIAERDHTLTFLLPRCYGGLNPGEEFGRWKSGTKPLSEIVLLVFLRDGCSQVLQSPKISLLREPFTEDGFQYLYF